MNRSEFFKSFLKESYGKTDSAEYNEGYNQIISDLHDEIKSRSIKSLNQVIDYLTQYESFISGYDNEDHRKGCQGAIDQCARYLKIKI